MQRSLHTLTQQVLESSVDKVSENKPLIDTLVQQLCEITNITLHPDVFMDEHATATPQGKAVSMTTAAQCAEEYIRTQIFLRGVYQAIQDQLQQHSSIEVLYAGSGPFGLLLIPLLPLFSPQQVQVTLLDIHPASLIAVRKVIEAFNVPGHIKESQCVDILDWQPSSTEHYDLIISETMKAMLEQEPQLAIFAHLSPYLAHSGNLIPEQIRIEGWLSFRSEPPAQPMYLGEVLNLNKDSALAVQQESASEIHSTLTIPAEYNSPADLKFTTHIQVYRQHQLSENQCSLSLPKVLHDANPMPGSLLTCHYQINQLPGFNFHYQSGQTEQPLPDVSDPCMLGVPHLQRIWQKTQLSKQSLLDPALHEQEWLLDLQLYDTLNLGLEPALQALFQCSTSQAFERFVLARNLEGITTEQRAAMLKHVTAHTDARQHLSPSPSHVEEVLSNTQMEFWYQHGYLVIPDVLTKTECQQTVDDICQFMDVSLTEPDSWYQPHLVQTQIMTPLFDSPALKQNRGNPFIHKVFAQLWHNDQLTMSTDRVSFNPPETDSWKFPGPGMHWDVVFKTPLPFATQGLIYLTDTTENQGAFCCVPDFHHQFDQWLDSLPAGTDPQHQDWSEFAVKPIAANAGDLIIWHHALPHGSSPNNADSPRVVQYINMYRPG